MNAAPVDAPAVDHVEFWVADAANAAADLAVGLGFRIGRKSASVDGGSAVWARQGGIGIRLVSPGGAGGEVAEFVERHGDGVAVIALRVADAGAAFAAALERGATRAGLGTGEGGRAIAGFGDVRLRFVDGDDGAAPPPTGSAAGHEDLLREIDHVAICVPAGHLAATADFCERTLGLRRIFTEYIDVGTQGMDSIVVQSPSGAVTFTFLEPDTSRAPGQIDGFLAAHGGAGVQHLAFLTDDIALAVDTFRERGVGFLGTPGSYYDLIEERLGQPEIPLSRLRDLNVLVDRDHGGQLFQIFTRSAHPRGTYFHELIERRGARTFGTANITSLYEAVERGRAGRAADGTRSGNGNGRAGGEGTERTSR